jgi:hypothetical protein
MCRLTFAAELSVHFPASAHCPAGFPGRGGRRRAGAVTLSWRFRETVTLAGRAEPVRAARRFVGEVLAPGTRAGMTGPPVGPFRLRHDAGDLHRHRDGHHTEGVSVTATFVWSVVQ